MSEYYLEIHGVSKAFQAVQALDNVELRLRPGEIKCLAGENGCGKSTQAALLRQFLEDAGYPVTYSREPGGCPISERIRDIILDVRSEGMSDECEALPVSYTHLRAHET